MATSAVETAKQENGSRLFMESVIENRKTPTFSEMRKVYDGYDLSWKSTYEKQTKALQKFLGIRKGYIYSRDTGIMPMIENIAKEECGVSVKDRWNPMDIVLVKKNMQKVVEGTIKELTNIDGMSKDAKLELLNAYMRETLNDKVLIGVSLKAIKENKKVATQELANMAKGSARTNIDYIPGSLKCDLTLGKKANYLFDTGELGFDLETESGGSIHGQSRNFQYSKARNVIQTDLTPKGKDAGAKLYNEIKDAKVGGKTIEFGEVAVYEDRQKVGEGIKTVIETAIKYETESMDRSSGGRFSSKLISLEWAKIWVEISEKKMLREWCTSLYYGAKKEFSSKNGPFLKIY